MIQVSVCVCVLAVAWSRTLIGVHVKLRDIHIHFGHSMWLLRRTTVCRRDVFRLIHFGHCVECMHVFERLREKTNYFFLFSSATPKGSSIEIYRLKASEKELLFLNWVKKKRKEKKNYDDNDNNRTVSRAAI